MLVELRLGSKMFIALSTGCFNSNESCKLLFSFVIVRIIAVFKAGVQVGIFKCFLRQFFMIGCRGVFDTVRLIRMVSCSVISYRSLIGSGFWPESLLLPGLPRSVIVVLFFWILLISLLRSIWTLWTEWAFELLIGLSDHTDLVGHIGHLFAVVVYCKYFVHTDSQHLGCQTLVGLGTIDMVKAVGN